MKNSETEKYVGYFYVKRVVMCVCVGFDGRQEELASMEIYEIVYK